MPELSVPRFGPVFGAVYSVLKFLVRWASGCSRRVLMMQGGVIRVNVCWDTYSVCQAVDENNEQVQAFFSQGDNPKISLLQKVEEMAPFA